MSPALQFYINIIVILLGPTVAIFVSVWLQNRREKHKEKIASKKHIFMTLMAYRKNFQISIDLVNALNLIHVVFEDCPEIVEKWNTVYELLHRKDQEEAQQSLSYKRLEMLSLMARHLGYKNLEQTDIDKYYYPQDYVDLLQSQLLIQEDQKQKAIDSLSEKYLSDDEL